MAENTVNVFEVAARSKFRFPYRGQVSVEDLYDLTTTELDSIFKLLNAQLKLSQEESLLDKPSKENEEVVLKIEIVRHIVNEKLAEKAAKLAAREKKERKQKILEIMADKQDEALRGKSIEELSKMIEEL